MGVKRDEGIGAPRRAARTAATTAGIASDVEELVCPGVGVTPGAPGVAEYGASARGSPGGAVAPSAVLVPMDRRVSVAMSSTSIADVPHNTALVLIGRLRVERLIGFSIKP